MSAPDTSDLGEPPSLEEIEATSTVSAVGPDQYVIELDEEIDRRMVIGRTWRRTVLAERLELEIHAMGFPGTISVTPKPEAHDFRKGAATETIRVAYSILGAWFRPPM